MSDFPNGRPPGQNNLDAGVERYVPVENDPSAGAQKPDADRPKEDGIVAKEPLDPKVQAELDQAAKNVVQPSTAEEQEHEEELPAPPAPKPAPAQNNKR
jgi:hypothetical protein